MKLVTHGTVGFSAGLLLRRFWGDIKSVFFFLGSTLIDSDHLIDFMWRSKCKSLNIKYIFRTTSAFVETQLEVLPNRKDTLSFFIFHSVEFLSFVGLFGIFVKSEFLSSASMGIFWGAFLHIVLDMIYVRKLKIRYAWSIIEFLVKRRLMRKRKIDPDKVYREILDSINATPNKKT